MNSHHKIKAVAVAVPTAKATAIINFFDSSNMKFYPNILNHTLICSFPDVQFFNRILIISNMFYMFKNGTIDDITLVFQGRV